MVDYRYLKAFLAAANYLNFTRAAEELKISVSALSRQISLLEQSCSTELFIRNTRQVALTPEGSNLLLSLTRFEAELKTVSTDLPMRIGCLQSVFEFFLADLIQKNQSIFDGPLDITIGTPEMLQVMTMNGELDFALTNLKPTPASNISGFKLFEEAVSWLGEKSGSRPKRSIIFSAFEQYYSEDHSTSKNRIRINSFDATVELTRRGVGQALVALPARPLGKLPYLDRQWIYAVMPNYKTMPPRLAKTVELLKRSAP